MINVEDVYFKVFLPFVEEVKISYKKLIKDKFPIERVEQKLVFEEFRKKLALSYPSLSIGEVEHAYNIGNNNAYPIIEHHPTDTEYSRVIGYFNAIDDMYGGVYAYMTDEKDKKNNNIKITIFINCNGVNEE